MLKIQISIFLLVITASSTILSMDDYSVLKRFANAHAIFEEGENTLPHPPKGSYDCYRIKNLTNFDDGTVQIDFEDQKGHVNTAFFTNDIQKGMLKKYLDGEMSARQILDECKRDPYVSLDVRMGGHNADSKIHLFYILHPGYSEEWQTKPWPIFVPGSHVAQLKNSDSFDEIDFKRPDEMKELVELKKLLRNDHEALLLAKNYILETSISINQFIQDVRRVPKALIKRGGLPVGFVLETPQSNQQPSPTKQCEKVVVKLPNGKIVSIPLNGLKTIDDLLLYIRKNSIYPMRLSLFDSSFKLITGERLLSQLDLSKTLEFDNEDWQDDHNW
jgi:hypothetical protein